MRCPSCNKFPPKDTDNDPEGDLEVDDEGMVSGDVRIVNTSECCGDELEETTFTVEIDLTDAVRKHLQAKHAAYLKERETPKPVEKPKPINPASVKEFDYCATCNRYWISHYVKLPGGKRVPVGQIGRPRGPKLADARKAVCAAGEGEFVPKAKKVRGPDEPSLTVETEISRTDETQQHDRHGRPIKFSRYRKRYYGIEVEATVRCATCDEEIATGTFSDRVQASGMDSLV